MSWTNGMRLKIQITLFAYEEGYIAYIQRSLFTQDVETKITDEWHVVSHNCK